MSRNACSYNLHESLFIPGLNWSNPFSKLFRVCPMDVKAPICEIRIKGDSRELKRDRVELIGNL